MSTPIRPSDVAAPKEATFPPEVIEVFNDLIAKNYSGGSATVRQKDAVAEIETRMGVDKRRIFAEGWLNVEEVYRAQGWKVEYDKPGYNESYDAFFVFRGK